MCQCVSSDEGRAHGGAWWPRTPDAEAGTDRRKARRRSDREPGKRGSGNAQMLLTVFDVRMMYFDEKAKDPPRRAYVWR